MQKHSYCLAKHMARQGIEVDVYYVNTHSYPENLGPAAFFGAEAARNIELVPVGSPRTVYFPGHHYFDCYVKSRAVHTELARRAEKVRFVYAQGYMGWETLRQRRRGAGLPPVGVNFHGLEAFQDESYGSVADRVLRLISRPCVRANLRRADVQLSLGGKLDHIIRRETDGSTPIIHSPNGIEEDWLAGPVPRTPHSPRRFVFVGRHTRRKGIEELYAAIRRLSGKHSFECRFIGPIPEDCKLDTPETTYHGLISDEAELRELLRACDVLICPSYAEGMPTVILEAMASGLPVIATNVGAVDTVVEPGNGWLIPSHDQDALTCTMTDTLKTPDDELAAMGMAAVKTIRDRWLWSHVAARTTASLRDYIVSSQENR